MTTLRQQAAKPKVSTIEAGFAIVHELETGRLLGYVSRSDMTGFWKARLTRNATFNVPGISGLTRREAAQALANHRSR